MENSTALQHLENFVLNNPLLRELEDQLAEFNIFEATGIVHQELKHSNFLAFLLNPSEKHGLDDFFLKRFLIHVLSVANNPPMSPITVDVTNFSNAIIEREKYNIDILIHDEANKLVCVIENKVFSTEHSDQLNRYRDTVERRFSSNMTFIYVFLTPEGDESEEENSAYIPISYGDVVTIIEHTVKTNASVLGADIKTAISHYINLVRRYIVSDSDIAKLSQQIYRAHKEAIDLIIEHIPDLRQDIAIYLAEKLDAMPTIQVIRRGKKYVSFGSTAWDKIPELNCGTGWSNYEKCIYCEFISNDTSLYLQMMIGPTIAGKENIAFKLYDTFVSLPLFNKKPRREAKWRAVLSTQLLRPRDYENANIDDLKNIIDKKCEIFFASTLPKINAHITSIDFSE